MGRRGSPRRLGVRGEELSKVVYDIAEMEVFAGRRVLVVGGGDSAVESVLGLSRQEGTTVHLSYRGEAFARVKPRNRERLDAVVRAGRATVFLSTRIAEILPDAVILEGQGDPIRLPNDDVIVRIGGEPPAAFLDKIGVRRVVKEIAVGESSSGAGV
jgi:thioredoxin reductase